ncbi:MAG TPA: hypothetical protein RMH99_23245 [Sandaracinaceae bacterium LLY-WYZ-13_1]|nr:hypothetical protein [Sandaracinaceae bacterium LLY-WYZ-13_1]
MRRARVALAALLLALVPGCAQNAIFELQIELPPAPSGEEWYAVVDARDSSWPFDTPWLGPGGETFELGPSRQWACLSVQSFDQTLDLHVRVQFCRSPDCLALEDGVLRERWYTIEHPFYIGRRTYHRASIDAVPACDAEMDVGTSCGDAGLCRSEGRCGCTTSADCGEGLRCERVDGEGTCLHAIGRCSIEGCIDGRTSNFCSGEDGTHYCEINPTFERDGYQCEMD